MKTQREEHVEKMQKMTLLHMNMIPLPKSIQTDIDRSDPCLNRRRIRTILTDDKLDQAKRFLLNGILAGKNYATIYAELLDTPIIPEGHTLQFRYITKMLHEIASTVCRVGSYDHRVFLLKKYVKQGMNKTQAADKLGMKREAAYMAYRKAMKENK